MSAQLAEQDPRCAHHKQLDSAIRALRDAAWSVESAASDIPDADEWLPLDVPKVDRQAFADRVDRIGAIAHDGHDAFPWRWCRVEVCLELWELREDLREEPKT